MAEVLVRLVDKINEDFYLNCQCTKRADIIVAEPNGWPWGKEEFNDPRYMIVKSPNVSLDEAQTFCAPELPVDPANPSKTLQKRCFRIDINNTSIPTPIRTLLTYTGVRA